jgi:LysR family glycine cleavage system transcriptional activator
LGLNEINCTIRFIVNCDKRVIINVWLRKTHLREIPMAERLPSLNALRAFEAAARNLSFTRAAAELHVTPTAISHQIKGLEAYLGVMLFHRLNRALVLTENGRSALPKLQEGFACLSEAVRTIQTPDKRPSITVSVAPSLTAKWLVSRLPRFAARHPDIDLQVSASDHQLDRGSTPSAVRDGLYQAGTDVAIRFGHGNYPGLRVDMLFGATLVPLCSPRLLTGEHPLRQPEDLRYHALIHDDSAYTGRPDWIDFFKAAGVQGVDMTRGLHFSHVSLAMEAAASGQGVVLSLTPLAADDLATGRLVIPFDLCLPVPYAYYMVCLEERAEQPDIATFRAWLLEEAVITFKYSSTGPL